MQIKRRQVTRWRYPRRKLPPTGLKFGRAPPVVARAWQRGSPRGLPAKDQSAEPTRAPCSWRRAEHPLRGESQVSRLLRLEAPGVPCRRSGSTPATTETSGMSTLETFLAKPIRRARSSSVFTVRLEIANAGIAPGQYSTVSVDPVASTDELIH